MRIFANANFDFFGRGRILTILGVALGGVAIVGMIVAQVVAGSWVNYGVEFTGGTMVQVVLPAGTDVAQVRRVAEGVNPGSTVTRFGAETEFLIRAPEFDPEGSGEVTVADRIVAALGAEYGSDNVQVVRTEAVGARVGGELQRSAAFAILFSLVATLVYLAFRFEWRFGLAAVIATAYDVLVTLGLISVFRLEVSLATVAAVVTIIGYSLNDKIVVFDRVRENVQKLGRRDTFRNITNRSINEVIPRTVLTAATTLAALIALLVFGGAVIRDFALILAVGVTVGTFSSMFIAAPALLAIERKWPRKEATKKGTTGTGRGRAKAARAQAAL